jgi:hypothetical protein
MTLKINFQIRKVENLDLSLSVHFFIVKTKLFTSRVKFFYSVERIITIKVCFQAVCGFI